MIKDSGERIKFESGAVRDIQEGKGRMDLLPMCALIRLSKHYEAGAVKYKERNWEQGIPIHSFMDSAHRHIAEYMDGATDEDHLCAAAWNLMCAMWTEEKKPEMQDIPARMCLGEEKAEEIRCPYVCIYVECIGEECQLWDKWMQEKTEGRQSD